VPGLKPNYLIQQVHGWTGKSCYSRPKTELTDCGKCRVLQSRGLIEEGSQRQLGDRTDKVALNAKNQLQTLLKMKEEDLRLLEKVL